MLTSSPTSEVKVKRVETELQFNTLPSFAAPFSRLHPALELKPQTVMTSSRMSLCTTHELTFITLPVCKSPSSGLHTALSRKSQDVMTPSGMSLLATHESNHIPHVLDFAFDLLIPPPPSIARVGDRHDPPRRVGQAGTRLVGGAENSCV